MIHNRAKLHNWFQQSWTSKYAHIDTEAISLQSHKFPFLPWSLLWLSIQIYSLLNMAKGDSWVNVKESVLNEICKYDVCFSRQSPSLQETWLGSRLPRNYRCKHLQYFFFLLGHTQDLYFSALGYETQSGMGFQINWYYIAFLHWSSWSWLHLLLHLIDFQLSRQVASCGEGDLAR